MPLEFSDQKIETLLRSYRLDELHASHDTIYAVSPDLTLAYVNRGWRKFAAENGGGTAITERWPIGSSIRKVIPEVLQAFYTDKFTECLESRSPWQHRYECSSAESYREFLMTTYPLGEKQGLLVVNSLCYDSPHFRASHEPVEDHYRNEKGMIVQCVHCRRVRRNTPEWVWDWVPQWINSYPEGMSHGICEPCFGYFYPGGLPMSGGYPKFFRTDYRTGNY